MARPTANTVTRDLPPMAMRAAVRPGSANAEKRTVELIWSTGAPVLRGYFDRWWEELSLEPGHVRLARLNNGAPFLDTHDMYSGSEAVYGVVVEGTAKVDGKEGVATVRFAKAEDDPEADKVFRKILDGILQNVSVGYRVWNYQELPAGADEIPVFRAVDWEPFEISVVPAGADDGAGFRSNNANRAPNACVFKERTIMDPTTQPTTPATPVSPAAPSAEATRLIEERAATAERERATAIRELVGRQALLATAARTALADDLVKRGVSIDAARAAVLDKVAEASEQFRTDSHVRIEQGEDARDKFLRGASAWIFERAMVSESIRAAQKTQFAHRFEGVSFDPGEFRGMKLSDLARASLEMRGISTKGLYGERLFERALSRGMNTASDFPVLLETAMYKTLLAAYATQPHTWNRFCGTKPVQDFRTATFYRNGSFGTLDAVGEAGEFKHKSIPDGEKATVSVSTKGNIIALSRQAMVNDDLGAFNDLGARWGSTAQRSIEVDVYALLALNAGLGPTQADAQPLFHTANRGNIGAAGAISAAVLSSIRQKMRAQKDPSGNDFLDLTPAVLLVPTGSEDAAKILNADAFDPAQTGQKTNPVRGLFRDIVSSARLTASTTRLYGFADPSTAPVIVVSFLDGQQEPEMRMEEGFEIDGVKWRVRIDYGVQVVDYRGAVTCAGV